MNFVATIFRSSLGKKYIMAISGTGLMLFVVAHLIGNLQVYFPDNGATMNRYAHYLKNTPEVLWPVRIGLLLTVSLHIATAVSLTIENRRSRPVRYEEYDILHASYASRTMIVSGLIVASFVIYHLLHFTAHTIDPSFGSLVDPQGYHDVRRMVITGFQNPLATLFYITGVGLLCWHLSHGIVAMLQSLGLNNPSYQKTFHRLAWAVAIALFAGYASIPVSIYTGLVK